MKKLWIVPLVAAVAVALLGVQPSGAVQAGQFCKKADLGVVVISDQGYPVRCSYVNGYYRWVRVSSPPATTTTTRPPATTTTTTTTPPPVREPSRAQLDAVFRLYRAYFLRDPDPSGLDYWASLYANGRSLASISQHFSESSEFQRRYGDLTNAEFVDLIYRNLFDRQADSSGRSYWTSVLDRGRSRGAVMIGFSESPEFKRITGTS